MFRKILIPLDGSRLSAGVVHIGVEIAKKFGSEIVVFRAVRPTPITTTMAGSEQMASPVTSQLIIESAKIQDRKNISKSNRYLSAKARSIKANGVKCDYATVIGDPAKSIMGFSKETGVELIVMTTSGKSGLKRAIMGSVADQVIRESGIPVLAVRPRPRRHKK